MKLSSSHKQCLSLLINSIYAKSGAAPKLIKKQISFTTKMLETILPESVQIFSSTDLKTNNIQLWLLLSIAEYGNLALSVTTENRENMMFSVLFRTISNTIYSIMLLGHNGLDYSGKALLRTLMEQYFILLSVTKDRDKRTAYLDYYEGKEATTSWYRNFKKDKFISTIQQYLEDEVLKKQITEWIDAEYSDYSSFVHNDYANILCYSFARCGDEKLYPNLCGQFITRECEILRDCFMISFGLTEVFYNMLRNQEIDVNIETLMYSELTIDREINLHLHTLRKNLGMIIIAELTGEIE